MDLDKILDELRQERDSLNDAILALQRLLPPDQRAAADERPTRLRRSPSQIENTSIGNE